MTNGVPPELSVIRDGPVLRLTLSRPERRNALSRSLVTALGDAFQGVKDDSEIRVVVLAGAGPAFCAGGDIAEFAEAARSGHAETDAAALAGLFEAITTCPAPVVARIHGAAYGGGVGLVAAADIAIADSGTRFSLSEARLGLVAAVISRYVIDALGWRAARAHMLRGAPFDVEEALRCGLVHQVAGQVGLDLAVEGAVSDVLMCAPGALALIKRLPGMIDDRDPATLRATTTHILAECLGSDETQEGLRAFLEKRPPSWVNDRAPR